MTYRPVTNPTGAGRPPMEIPPTLLSLLRQSYDQGQRVTIPRQPDDPPEAVDDLRKALTRAGYRHFPDKTIHKRFRDNEIVFWVTDKKGRKKK